jgi:hypothetical protein
MKAQFVSENISFQKGQDPKETMRIGKAGKIDRIINDENEFFDLIVNIDQALGSAMEIYLPIGKKKRIARMWLEDAEGLRNWSFRSLTQSEDDEEYYGDDYIPIEEEVSKYQDKGWNLLHIEDNYGLKEAILYKEGGVNESVRFERASNPKKGMELGKYAPEYVEVKDWDGNPMKIKVQDNEFSINDYHIRVEFVEEDEYGDGELEKKAKVYVDGQDSDMTVFFMKPSPYEFFVPKKPTIQTEDGKWTSDPNPENWSKTESAYGFPLVDEEDEEGIKEMQEKHGYWLAMSGDIDRSAKNPFKAIAELFMTVY